MIYQQNVLVIPDEEPYTWRELMTSTGAYKYGIWIERNA